uniref:Uncharacterized protein n=1 Tax=Paramormyrops kingsleyae TaxID=1676925 RepID=A0A3B3SWB7_9TELE
QSQWTMQFNICRAHSVCRKDSQFCRHSTSSNLTGGPPTLGVEFQGNTSKNNREGCGSSNGVGFEGWLDTSLRWGKLIHLLLYYRQLMSLTAGVWNYSS